MAIRTGPVPMISPLAGGSVTGGAAAGGGDGSGPGMPYGTVWQADAASASATIAAPANVLARNLKPTTPLPMRGASSASPGDFATRASACQRLPMEQTGKAEQSATARSFVIAQTTIASRPLEPALYLVATPIGNLSDITVRALETLAGADIVACEDTRVTRVLLDRYGIRQRPTPYHEHNADVAGPRLVAALGAGRSVALVSDAGTPLVSDPGYRLVERALAAGIRVVPIPGASAVLAALTASGLPSDTFLFGGFLPSKGGTAAEPAGSAETDRRDADFLRIAAPACRNARCHGSGASEAAARRWWPGN